MTRLGVIDQLTAVAAMKPNAFGMLAHVFPNSTAIFPPQQPSRKLNIALENHHFYPILTGNHL